MTQTGTLRAAQKAEKRDTLNIRIKPADKILIDRAASVSGKTRTDFILEAARSAAEETLVSQTITLLDPAAFDAFIDRLDQPPQPNPALRKTLQTPAPWER